MKIKYFLLGAKTSVCIFSYDTYRTYLSKYFERVWDYKKADIIIISHVNDIFNNLKCTLPILTDPSLKIFLLSEEPLWDSMCEQTLNPKLNKVNLEFSNFNFEINLINHLSSDLFDYKEIPFFLTTNKQYAINYILSLKTLSSINEKNILSHWKNKKYNFCAIERNLSSNPIFQFKSNSDIPILSQERSKFCFKIHKELDKTFIFGEGWESLNNDIVNSEKLQHTIYSSHKSCFWHKEKLHFLQEKSQFLMSSENTMCKNYITEKFFDGPATLSVPLFIAKQDDVNYKKIKGVNLLNFNEDNTSIKDFISEINAEEVLLHNLNYVKRIFSGNIFHKINQEIYKRCENLKYLIEFKL